MAESTFTRKKFRILLLVVFDAILIIALSWFVIDYVNSHRFSLNEKCAIAGLKRICASEMLYKSASHTFTDDVTELLEDSGRDEPFLNSLVEKGSYHGYHYVIKTAEQNDEGRFLSWSATAWPVEYPSTGFYTFYIDENGLIRGSDIGGGKGDKSLPIIKSQNYTRRHIVPHNLLWTAAPCAGLGDGHPF